MSDTNVNEVTWDDESIKLSELVFFKGEKNVKKRIFIMTPAPKVARIHYKDKYFFCHSTFENKDGTQVMTKKAKCCEALGDPGLRFGVVVCVFDTKKDGMIKPRDKQKPGEMDFEFQIWRFREDKFGSLKTKHSEWDLTKHDLMLTCTEEQYQRIEIDVMKGAWMNDNTELGKRIRREFELYKFKDPFRFLGQSLSEGEVVIITGGELEEDDDPKAGQVNEQGFEEMLEGLKDGGEDKKAETKEPAKAAGGELSD